MAGRKEEEDQEKDEEEPDIPTYNPQPAKSSPVRPGHAYNLRPRPKPAPQKLVRKVESASCRRVWLVGKKKKIKRKMRKNQIFLHIILSRQNHLQLDRAMHTIFVLDQNQLLGSW